MPAPLVNLEVDAANLALGNIGEPTIASLDDNHPSARACRRFYATCRDAVLRAHWWNFAAAWITPARVTPDSAGPLRYRFQLPADCLAVRQVRPDRDGDPLNEDDWAVETAVIVDALGATVEVMMLVTGSATPPLVCYTRRVETVRLWDDQFKICFGHELASLVCNDIAHNAGETARQHNLFLQKLPEAKRSDVREKAVSRASPNLTSWGAARR